MNDMRKWFLFCLLIFAHTSNAALNDTLAYSYYSVNADSAVSLLKLLNTATPIREKGKSFHGYTKWYIKWNFWWFEKPDGQCKLTKVATKLTATITLPELVGADSTQKIQFDNYLSALSVHELGHYDIGKQAAVIIDEKISALPEMSSCKVLESTANDIGYQTLDEYKAIERQYDVSTNHGKTQGAWLER
jgi:predicted secreted Zn-dependent protease